MTFPDPAPEQEAPNHPQTLQGADRGGSGGVFDGVDVGRLGVEYLSDRLESRWNSPHPIKRYIHRAKIAKICRLLRPGETLLDIGRGGSVDGILGVFAAKKGLHVTISSVSTENLAVIQHFAAAHGVDQSITWVKASPLALPFPDGSFDTVAALHILEHLPHIDEGLRELYRLTKGDVIVALPTCLNPCAFSRLGGADYFQFSYLAPLAFLYGLARVCYHAARHDDGVDEIMEEFGRKIVHTWRFPAAMRALLMGGGFDIVVFEPDCICLPWSPSLLWLMQLLDRYGRAPVLRNLGLGSHALVVKRR